MTTTVPLCSCLYRKYYLSVLCGEFAVSLLSFLIQEHGVETTKSHVKMDKPLQTGNKGTCPPVANNTKHKIPTLDAQFGLTAPSIMA